MRLHHILFILLIDLIWGANFIATRWTVLEIPPIFASASRFVVVAALLLPFVRLRGVPVRPLVLTGLVLGIGHFGFMYLGMALTEDVSSMAVVTLSNVPFATLLAVIFLGERIGGWRVGGLALAFSGVAVLSFDPKAFEYIDAMVIVLISSFLYAVGAIMMRRLPGISAFTLQAAIAVISAPVLLLISVIFESGQLAALQGASIAATGGIIYSAIGATIIGHGGIYYLLQRYPVTTVTPYTLLAQLFAVLLSLWMLDEALSQSMMLGAVVAFVGVLVITLRNRDSLTKKLVQKAGPAADL